MSDLTHGARQATGQAPAAYIGDTTLVQSLWMIARARGLTVHLGIQPPQGSSHADRRALAAHLREQIAAALLSQ